MKLYHNTGSPPSRSVLMTARVLDLDIEVETVNLLKGQNKSEEFKKLNATHQVPVLVDDSFVLSESKAIQAYLVNSRAPNSSWYPTNPKSRAVIDQRLYFDSTVFFAALRASLGPVFFGTQVEVSAENREKLKQAIGHLENFLDGKKFFAGDLPTIADIAIVSNIIQFKNAFGELSDEHRNLRQWFKRCEKLTGFEENVAGGKFVADYFKAKGLKLAPIL